MLISLHKVLQLCERQCFLWPVLINKDSTSLVKYFKFGFAGELLKNNIYQEWLLSMVVNTDENIFPFHSQGVATRDIVKGNTFSTQLFKYLVFHCYMCFVQST
jgi:glycyl-tRNA synthetase (class II)